MENDTPELDQDTLDQDTLDQDHPDLPSFDIGLSPTGDVGSAFRTKNDPSAPYQRQNYIERRGALSISCSSQDVIHGLFSPSADSFATLIVLKFRFHPRKQARRFESVNISLEFSGSGSDGGSEPEVYAISPEGRYKVNPTSQHEEVKRNAGLQLGGAAPVGGLTATGSVGWEKTVSRETSDGTSVTGSIDLKGRSWGLSNAASWTLLENRTAKTGVPAMMQTVVLLKRKDEGRFQCVVKIDAVADFRSRMEKVFGGKGRDMGDDPVLFDPEMDPTNRLREYDVTNLGDVDLEILSDVKFAPEFGAGTKS